MSGIGGGLTASRATSVPSDGERRQAVHRRVVLPPHGELELVAQLVERAAVHGLDGGLEALVAVELLVHQGNAPVAVGVGQPAVDLPADRIDDRRW